ncbi:branched-chain amino acid ABC transporter permease [Bordetella genomosp. 12]|uniref:branched-chain amino acid ABC transporter permease n=1 Tax=Bordetella genomosp. 12 TaxID=463035 RepID=UPI00142D7366|nr:branched-chain amino acid ABC transporter permease [Bordetella genomosp. 12]
MISAFLQTLIDGLLIGGVYGVIAVGLSLVFGVLKIVNFAQAEFLMIGMYAAWFAWAYLGLDPVLGAFVSLAVGFALGALCQRLLVQHVLKAPPVAQIFLTVGLLAVIENGALMLFGSEFRSVRTPYQTAALEIGPLFISVPYLVAFIAALVISGALWLLLTRSWIGRAIRATSQNANAAQLFGIDTRTVYAIAFGLGTGLTAFGGGVILSYSAVSPTAGAQFVVLMFTVVVLGGLGSVLGALVGGLIVGVIQSLSTLVMPIQLQNLALFVVFITFLAFRPQGLLGKGAR